MINFNNLTITILDSRLQKLKITFPGGWKDISEENPDGPPTFINEVVDKPGVLQITTADYIGGEIPNPTCSDLVDLSEETGQKNQFGKILSKQSGSCRYGKYGLVEFSRFDFPYIAVWHLSDGKNFIFATFICSANPDKKQINDVNEILMSIRRRSFLGF